MSTLDPTEVPALIVHHRIPEKEKDLCQWFLMCTNKHVKVREHSSIGWVPICERCDQKIADIVGARRSF